MALVCCSLVIQNSYFGVGGTKDAYNDYSLVVAMDSDAASMLDFSSTDPVPVRVLDMQTGLITSDEMAPCQLISLLPHQIAHYKLRQISHAIATDVNDVRRLELLTPFVTF